MDTSEFDRFADEYLTTHARNLRLSGESPEYFAAYKIVELRRALRLRGVTDPGDVLDFGTGVGNSLGHLAEAFPGAKLTGVDVSQRSLELAARRFPGVASLVLYDGGEIPLEAASQDLVFSACVFHHIPHTEHLGIFSQIRRLLRPGGVMVIFEHNPLNPATRHIVATCPFDANAVLLRARSFRESQLAAGFREVSISYTAFFPGPLRALRPLERLMTGLPLGAQYYTLARA
jgi:SAM-dependent methyltransferase